MTIAAEHVIPVDYDDDDHLDAAWLNVFEQRIDDIRAGRVALVGREEGNARIRARLAELRQQ